MFRLLLAVLLAVGAGLPAPEVSGADEVRTFPAAHLQPGEVVFRTAGIRPGAAIRARLVAGRYRRSVAFRRLERGIRRGLVRVPVPGRVARHLRRGDVRPRLIVVTRNFPEFDGFSATHASLGRTRATAYLAPGSLQATYGGPGGLSFARTWYDVSWHTGSDVWYGAALYIPSRAALEYADLVRWDNFKWYGSGGDVGGINVDHGKMSLVRQGYGGSNFVRLVGPFGFAQGRWFWIEVHQRFSGQDGSALSEVYVDGRRVGRSTCANSTGRRIDNIRFGYVYVEGEQPSTLYFDRPSISRTQRGPLGRRSASAPRAAEVCG